MPIEVQLKRFFEVYFNDIPNPRQLFWSQNESNTFRVLIFLAVSLSFLMNDKIIKKRLYITFM